jgi:5-methylcytosine-specific restriction endonuclease McrA
MVSERELECGRKRYWKNRQREIDRSRQYHARHPNAAHEYYLKNRDRIRENAKKRALSRPKVRSKNSILPLKERRLAYYKLHAEKIKGKSRRWYKDNRVRSLLKSAQWRKSNPEKQLELSRAYVERRRARLRGAAGWNYTTSQHIRWRWEMWGNKCWMCGAKAEETDHIISLEKGGSHWPANLRPACKHCNRSKRRNL